MRNFLALAAILPILFLTSAPAIAQQQTSKQDDIRTLIELAGTGRIANQMVDLMVPQMQAFIRQLRPDISPEHLKILMDEMSLLFRESTPKFMDAVIPLYEKRFTQEEIRGVIAFYKTPAGQKMLAELPGLMAEGMQIGQAWGQSVGRAAAERVQVRIRELGI